MRYLLCLIFSVVTLGAVAVADMGPKPTFYIAFKQTSQKTKLTISSATLLSANEPHGEFVKFREMGPQRFEVHSDHLFAMAYGFPKYLKVEIKFSDGKFYRSNVFQTTGMDSSFDMTIEGKTVAIKPSKETHGRKIRVVPKAY